ncbi:MAG TPA: rRNA maturation RNase YbeY [Clostridia bacterium]|jgi:probable rRNA maturation factor|nr:rRNA maturation RNase YbeY [Clostridia bacterium]
MEVLISNEQEKIEISEDLKQLIKQVVEETLALEQVDKPVEVSIALVDNDEIRQLNKKYRQIDSATDVLSFPFIEDWRKWEPQPYEEKMVLGDIIISLEKAVEQAENYGHSLERELAFLTVHGVLHLLGYDHKEEEERKLMRGKEELVLSSLGQERKS